MRRPRVLSTSPAVTQEKALEIANNFEPDFAAKTRAQVLIHRSRSSFQSCIALLIRTSEMGRVSPTRRVIGHRLGGVIGVYDRATHFERKSQALKALADLIERIVDEPTEGGKVVPLRAARTTRRCRPVVSEGVRSHPSFAGALRRGFFASTVPGKISSHQIGGEEMASDTNAPKPVDKQYIAFVVYPGLTLLDLVGPLQTLRILGAPYYAISVGERLAPVPTDTGLSITPEATFAEIEQPFAIVVPGGGLGTIQAMADPAVQGYLRQAAETATFVTSVCTGALVLAAAGLLEGRDATTHWAYAHYLNNLGSHYRRERWVEDGKFITAAGVSAGIDMALHLAAKLTNQDRAQRMQADIEYDPQPPFGRLDWSKADVNTYSPRLDDADERRAYFTPVLQTRPDVLAKMLA